MNEKTVKPKRSISINVDEDLYIEFKKALLDNKTNTTASIIKYMKSVVASNSNSKGE